MPARARFLVRLATGSPRLGTPTLGIIREAQAADPARPLNKSTKRQRAMTRLKEDLGEELTERAVRFAEAVDGTTGDALRERAGSKPQILRRKIR